ncbi:hypothetical protein ARMSODRAFT_910761 [Armillaria solidipes]|uniref:MYND-type domain-containing protein n=1 Tax=Armillaria solidipes TaxID=1076256 RepID=A0A2H3C4Y8_9AGAR|nr:hypothetical protein ARMSODRAFT_910761 [Armillaria solidipes]
MQNTCLVCDTPVNTRCAKCTSVYYCSKAHIAQDWPMHKAYCKRVRAATNTFDAILFGVDEIKPRAIKLPWSYGPQVDDDPRGWQLLEREPWLGGKDRCPYFFYVGTFGVNGPSLGRILALYYDENFLINGSPINRCIQNITKGKAAHPWAGNVLALRSKGLRSLDWYNDAIIEEDLAPLVRFFEDYGKEDDPAVRGNDVVSSKKRENAQVAADIASASVTAEPGTADLKPFAFVVFVLLFFLCTVLI